MTDRHAPKQHEAVRRHKRNEACCLHKAVSAQELSESRGGRPGFPVPNSPYGLCGREATLKKMTMKQQSGGRTNDYHFISTRC